jgi:hypothetical protein
MNADGTEQVPITGKGFSFLDWSPDGSRVLLGSNYDPFEEEQLYSANPDGTDLVRIEHSGGLGTWGP